MTITIINFRLSTGPLSIVCLGISNLQIVLWLQAFLQFLSTFFFFSAKHNLSLYAHFSTFHSLSQLSKTVFLLDMLSSGTNRFHAAKSQWSLLGSPLICIWNNCSSTLLESISHLSSNNSLLDFSSIFLAPFLAQVILVASPLALLNMEITRLTLDSDPARYSMPSPWGSLSFMTLSSIHMMMMPKHTSPVLTSFLSS